MRRVQQNNSNALRLHKANPKNAFEERNCGGVWKKNFICATFVKTSVTQMTGCFNDRLLEIISAKLRSRTLPGFFFTCPHSDYIFWVNPTAAPFIHDIMGKNLF
jgi:hypothetical protein